MKGRAEGHTLAEEPQVNDVLSQGSLRSSQPCEPMVGDEPPAAVNAMIPAQEREHEVETGNQGERNYVCNFS